MARTPTDRSPPQGVDAAGHDTLLAAKRGAVLHGLTLLAELGRQDASDVAYLARQDASRALVGVHVWPRADERGYEFAIVFELDVSLPGPPGICPVCGRAAVGWTRYCSCGADVSGMSQPPTPDDKREQLEKIRRATRDEYEIVGSLAYNSGGGAVYFGRHRERGDIVPLRAYEKEPGGLVTVAAGATLPAIGATSPYSGPVSFSAPPGQPAGAAPPPPPPPAAAPRISGPGSLRLRRQSPPTPGIAVAVPKVCPQCGEEYDTVSRFCPRDGSPLPTRLQDGKHVFRVAWPSSAQPPLPQVPRAAASPENTPTAPHAPTQSSCKSCSESGYILCVSTAPPPVTFCTARFVLFINQSTSATLNASSPANQE